MLAGNLIQLFDVYLEGKANGSIGDKSWNNPVLAANPTVEMVRNKAYQSIFGDKDNYKNYYLKRSTMVRLPRTCKIKS